MLKTCADCTTRYAVDLHRCPNCGSADIVEVEVETHAPELPPTSATKDDLVTYAAKVGIDRAEAASMRKEDLRSMLERVSKGELAVQANGTVTEHDRRGRPEDPGPPGDRPGKQG